jgi:hypothetical protein
VMWPTSLPPADPKLLRRMQQAVSVPSGASQGSGIGPSVQAEPSQRKEANSRFRSFAERYIIERCKDWKEGEIDERAWACILEAQSIYAKVKEFSRNVSDY